jgi:phosphopantetheinyl transferase
LKEENGRPYFPDRQADFNISHSGTVTAVSLVDGGNFRTGCDVQLVRKRVNTMKIAEEFFSASEREYISHSETGFFQIWVLKECFLKLRGLSVFDMAQAPSFIRREDSRRENLRRDDSDRLQFSLCMNTFSPLVFYLYELAGAGQQYFLSAAIEGGHFQPAIQWFSQDFLSCRNVAEIRKGE